MGLQASRSVQSGIEAVTCNSDLLSTTSWLPSAIISTASGEQILESFNLFSKGAWSKINLVKPRAGISASWNLDFRLRHANAFSCRANPFVLRWHQDLPCGLQNIVLVEIQDTLKQGPSESQTFKKAMRWGIVTTVSPYDIMSMSYFSYIVLHDVLRTRREQESSHGSHWGLIHWEVAFSTCLSKLEWGQVLITQAKSVARVQTLFYVGLGSASYAAFGRETPGNILTEFGFYKPYCTPCPPKLIFLHLSCAECKSGSSFQALYRLQPS